ncbi:unnamed protein product [Notodromas monacha]|uniref:G-protein coupled receptors family 1 profile domain-containing protein n=1 Tax=Notodromas monacha TaxID=399045 RepID=A0A7R9G9Y1_9CRUS|nr:unnamed protein product [Notodromas monacha]CAG0914738.1 unnamed protein product [Notodromas monacha]
MNSSYHAGSATASYDVNDVDVDAGFGNYSYSENRFVLPLWKEAVWSCLFGGMVFVSTAGNVVVVWIITAHKRMRTVTNYLIANLSVADVVVSTLNVVFNFIYMLSSTWPFGATYCKISSFIGVLSVSASVLSLVCISLDRRVVVLLLLLHHHHHHHHHLLCTYNGESRIPRARRRSRGSDTVGVPQTQKGGECLMDYNTTTTDHHHHHRRHRRRYSTPQRGALRSSVEIYNSFEESRPWIPKGSIYRATVLYLVDPCACRLSSGKDPGMGNPAALSTTHAGQTRGISHWSP